MRRNKDCAFGQILVLVGLGVFLMLFCPLRILLFLLAVLLVVLGLCCGKRR